MAPMPGRFEVLKVREFRLLYFAATVSFVGNTFTAVSLAFGVLAATGSVTAIGIVVAARQLTQVLLLLVGGAWGDRVSRRALIASCYVGAAATQTALAVLLLSGTGRTWNLAAVAAVNGAVTAFLGPSANAVLPQLVPRALLQQANALFSITRNSANIGGAVLAGLLVAATAPGWALAIDGASFAAAAALIVRLPPMPATGSRIGIIQELREGWREFVARTWVWAIVVQFAVVVMGYTAGIEVYAPVVAKQDLGGAHAYGLVIGAFGLGAVAGGVLMLRLVPSRPMITATVGMLASAGLFATLAAGSPLAVVMLAAAAGGVGIEVFGVLWSSALQEHIPPHLLSRVNAYDAVGSLGLAPLGSGFAGPVAVALGGVRPGLWLVVALIAIPTLLVLGVPDLWRLRSSGSSE